ncbi:winged helix-turn-helix domain-containing protein [Ralstonia pseudosolanacearum]|uniref:winged helix-turn-helix domain-containing protein n=1 Tax=Ralstonia pseudosolanacearum TaxID=1310165 RepID=UPI003AAC2AB5
MVKRWKYGIRLQLEAGIAIGPGKAELLQAIASSGSISGASRQMGMGYKTAWMMVESMNECFVAPLVETSKGGNGRGGASLTQLGLQVLERYRAMEEKAARAIEREAKDFERLLRSPAQ